MDTPTSRLVIPAAILDAMIAHAHSELPNECCGVLAGTNGTVSEHFSVRNDLASPTAYSTNARDLLNVHRATREAGTDWLAIYHSHPASAAVPSKTDLAENTYGTTVVHIIIGLANQEPDVRGWRLADASFEEVPLAVE